MSYAHAPAISSLSCGLVLGFVIRSGGECSLGFSSVQAIGSLAGFMYSTSLSCLYRVRSDGMYAEHNRAFMSASTACGVPRAYVTQERIVSYLPFMSAVLGLCEALVSVLPATSGDGAMLAAISAWITTGRRRTLCLMVLCYCIATRPFPHVYGMVRGLCLALLLLCGNLHLPLRCSWLRLIVSIIVSISVGGDSCTNWVRAVPPGMFMFMSLRALRASAPSMFIIASLLS